MQFQAPDARTRARRVRLAVFDIDGVLTDGRLWYGAEGEALKAFHAFDGQGIKLLQAAGVEVAFLSSRSAPAAATRARELGVRHALQGVGEKARAFRALLRRLGLKAEAACYMGDDVVDLPVLRRCGFACVPREAPVYVRRHAHYVPSAAAGRGAAREVCDFVLEAQGRLVRALERVLR